MNKKRLVALAAAALLAACGDQQPEVTGPTLRPPADPNAAVLDGNNGGNPDFFFLPPLVKDPTGAAGYRDDPFNGKYSPTVEVCVLKYDAAANVYAITDANRDGRCDERLLDESRGRVALFSGSQVTVSTSDELYKVNWDTGLSSLDPATNYRIRVLVGAVELGHADLDPVNASAIKDAKTGDFIPLIDGRTLPIKFRIERGALVRADDPGGSGAQFVERVVPNIGTDVRAGVTGTVLLTAAPEIAVAGAFFPNGWLDGQTINGQPVTEVTVVVEELPFTNETDCHPGSQRLAPYLQQYGKCIRYSTIPALAPLATNTALNRTDQFAQPVTVGFCRELPTDAPQYDALRVYRSKTNVEDAPVAIPVAIYTRYFTLRADCDVAPATVTSRSGILHPLSNGVGQVASALARLLGPKPLYAVDLGLGGETREFSDFNFGLEATLEIPLRTGGDGQAGFVGQLLPIPVTVAAVAPHAEATPGTTTGATTTEFLAVPGVAVTFTVGGPANGACVVAIGPGGGCVTSTTAVTPATGTIPVGWQLGSLPGTYTLTATTPGRSEMKTVTFTATALATTTGRLIDQVGDATANSFGTPDVVSSAVALSSVGAVFRVRFAPGTFDPALTHVTFSLDTDRNVQTGSPGVDAGGNDGALMGTDAIVEIGSFYNGAHVKLATGGPNAYGPSVAGSPFAATYVTDGVDVTIPLSALGERDGLLSFKATSSTRLGATASGFTGVQDYVSNLGLAPGITAPGVAVP